jgi:hypothetical protein
MNKLFAGYKKFNTRDGKGLYFVKASKNHERILCWEDLGASHGWDSANCRIISIDTVEIESLKSLKIWDSLSDEKREELENLATGIIEAVKTVKGTDVINVDDPAQSQPEPEVAKKRKRRSKEELAGVPDQLVCKCGYVQKKAFQLMST